MPPRPATPRVDRVFAPLFALLFVLSAGGAAAQEPPGALSDNLAAPDALHVAVVLDDSGSMMEPMPGSGESKMTVAKTALREVFAALPPGARVGVYLLNGYGAGLNGGSELLPIAPHAAQEVNDKLEFVFPGGGTPLGERIAQAAEALRVERAARKYGDYRLLIVTDGEATDPDRMSAAVPAALGAGLTVDVIGVAMRGNHALATQVDRYRRADDPAALREALREVLAESTGDGSAAVGDAGANTDYELLAPLPDGAAAVALTALSNPSADTAFPDPPPADVNGPPHAGGPSAGGPHAGGPNNAAGGSNQFEVVIGDGDDLGDTLAGGACCCLIPVAGIGLVGFVLFKLFNAGPNHRGGRRRRNW